MKKIAFISMANLYLCPYIRKYLDAIEHKAHYDIIYWNRHDVKEDDYGAEKTYIYEKSMNDTLAKPKKLLHMIGYCRYVRKIIKKNHYDGLIFLHTNAAILLHNILKRQYCGRFILDIRDYSMEKNRLYYFIEEQLVHVAAGCFISSEGFRNFLPPFDGYHMVHNNIAIDPGFVAEFRRDHQGNTPIRISFIGLIRFFEQNQKIAERLGGDLRFQLNYFGKNAVMMKQCLEEYPNLSFADQFPPEQTLSYYQQTDLINNAYGNHDLSLDYAYSNKLYYAATLGLPLLVSPETYMAQVVTGYDIGFVFDCNDPQIGDKLYQYYTSIDWPAFYRRCEAFCKTVEQDDAEFNRLIGRFVSDNSDCASGKI